LPVTGRLRRLKRFSNNGEKWTTQRLIVVWSMLMPRSAIISAQAQAVRQIPANAHQDPRLVEMTALEHLKPSGRTSEANAMLLVTETLQHIQIPPLPSLTPNQTSEICRRLPKRQAS
jgi:hypothetical protein